MNDIAQLHNLLRLTILMLASLAVIFGFRKRGLKVYKSTLVMAVLSPFLFGLFQQLPLWVLIPGLIIFIAYLFRKFVGEAAFGNFFGAILYDVFWKLPIRIILAVGNTLKSIYRNISE